MARKFSARFPAALSLTVVFLCGWPGRSRAAAQINPPLGPYVNLTPAEYAAGSSFGTNDLLVGTHYFYWYDVYSQAHIIDGDGTDALTDHPASMVDFSYKSKAWHRQQLTNMMAAGIDFLLPVSWGDPSERPPGHELDNFSFAGLGPLVAAREDLLAEGKHPPVIGMFYDTSTLQYNSAHLHIDLTTAYGQEWFYESIRDFFSLIPPKHWAMIGGRPVIFLYNSAFAAAYDQTCLDFAKQSFARDFGGVIPYIVRETSWQVQADNVYSWGGALGLKNPGVASLGPGYNDSAVPGRGPTIVGREGGYFFQRNWTRFLRSPSKIVVVETWNEFHEGTDVADSLEYGRAYLQMNRQYADMFKQGIKPPYPRGPYTDVKFVAATLQQTNLEAGLDQVEGADGVTTATNIGGSNCRGVVTTTYGGRYIYFRVHDSFKWSTAMQLSVQVDYFDSAGGSFRIEFDGSDPNSPFQGAYSPSGLSVPLTGSNTWRSAVFPLTGVKFLNSENNGADFRIAVTGTNFYVRYVKVIRPGMPDEAGQPVTGFQDDFSSSQRGTNWFPAGAGGNTFLQTNGVLKVGSAAGGLGWLLLDLPGASPSAQEVLARVRLRRFDAGFNVLGGVAAGVNTNDGSGLNFYFITAGGAARSLRLHDQLLPVQPVQDFAWTTNTWYWLRLLHQTNAAAGAADVQARIWPADGITAEPTNWLSARDYFPQYAARAGAAGITAGGGSGSAELEFDYFLLKAAGLPPITATLPPHKPALAAISARWQTNAAGLVLGLQAEPWESYLIETSINLTNWQGWTTLVLTNGATEISDPAAPGPVPKHYRARFMGGAGGTF